MRKPSAPTGPFARSHGAAGGLTRRGITGGILVASPMAAWAAKGLAAAGAWTTLGTPEQIAKEALALRLMASAPVQAELRDLEQLYAQDSIAGMPMAPETLKAAAASMAMSATFGATNKDVDRPAILWGSNAAHRWHGIDMPRSGLVQDNPDNVYRSLPIDGAAKYEIHGKVKAPAPAQQTFVLYSGVPGASGGPVREHLEEAGSIALNDIPIASDGSFVITIDSSPPAGRPNHLQTSQDSRNSYILIRDTLSNWMKQNPVALTVRRVGGPPLRPALSEAELAVAAAKQVRATGGYWLAWEHRVFFDRPVNTYTTNWKRGSGWGFTRVGHFRLAPDEALIATYEPRQADYFAVQVADLWGPTVEYTMRNGSLNQSQARPNADGSFSFVISPNDPGVYNWLDTGGLPAGTFQVRWQKMPPGVTDEGAVRMLKVVKLQDLKSELPPETVWVTPEARRAQLDERVASYMRRLTI
jgi:hypothetical protein